MCQRGEAQTQKGMDVSKATRREKQREIERGSRTLGTSEHLPAAPWGCTVLGQSESEEAEDVGIKGQLSVAAAAEAQGTKASSSWKPIASCTELSPGAGLEQCRQLEGGRDRLHRPQDHGVGKKK